MVALGVQESGEVVLRLGGMQRRERERDGRHASRRDARLDQHVDQPLDLELGDEGGQDLVPLDALLDHLAEEFAGNAKLADRRADLLGHLAAQQLLAALGSHRGDRVDAVLDDGAGIADEHPLRDEALRLEELLEELPDDVGLAAGPFGGRDVGHLDRPGVGDELDHPDLPGAELDRQHASLGRDYRRDHRFTAGRDSARSAGCWTARPRPPAPWPQVLPGR
jgi:hypothetical protein